MKNRLFFILLAGMVIAFAAGVYYVFFYDVSEKRYNKIMCYYIARDVTDGTGDFYEKIARLRDFVNENIMPIDFSRLRLDTCAIEKLTTGSGWCDQQARVFMQLARGIGITSRLLFLRDGTGSSPHSIAEALAPDKRWVIVDSAFKLDLRNKKGDFATRSDVRNDIGIVRDNDRIKLRAKFEEAWGKTGFLSIYSNPPTHVTCKKVNAIDYLKFVPTDLLRPAVAVINQRYLDRVRPGIENPFEFKMAKARTQHLLGYYGRASALYDDIIRNSGEPRLIRKAQYFNAVLLKDQDRYSEACDYITGVLKKDRHDPYGKFLIGLRARILNKTGKPLEADRDLESVGYDLEV